jgi:hypothetical protein
MAKRAMGKISKINDSLSDCRATIEKCREILQRKAGVQVQQCLGPKPIDMSCRPKRSSARAWEVEAQNGEQLSKVIDTMRIATYTYSCKNRKEKNQHVQ